jgi:hypothetical protein
MFEPGFPFDGEMHQIGYHNLLQVITSAFSILAAIHVFDGSQVAW